MLERAESTELEDYRMPSRFIEEIPPELINHVDRHETAHRPVVRSYDPDEPDIDVATSFDYSVGEFVFHPKFGKGKITGISGAGAEYAGYDSVCAWCREDLGR